MLARAAGVTLADAHLYVKAMCFWLLQQGTVLGNTVISYKSGPGCHSQQAEIKLA